MLNLRDKWPGTSSRNRGFTLLEVMAAVAIIAIVLVAVYRMHAQTLSMTNAARFYTLAPLLAQRALTEISLASENGESATSGDFGDELPGYAWEAETGEVESEALGEVAEDLKQIRLTVSLNEGEFTYSLRTYRLMPDKG